ncbi:MAG: FAD synthetase family protein [Treponema sp.]|nr:FAD synthetase family protein [Treponema sp.]
MRIIEWPEFLENALPEGEKNSAVTVGVFDGLHRGHKALIQRVVQREDGAVPVVVTFKRGCHKKAQGGGREYPGDILSSRQKMAAFEGLGVSVTIVIEFSESFRRMSGADFLSILQDRAKMSFLAVGSNFRCGYQLDTDALAIQSLNARRNIPTAVVPVLMEGPAQISSSHIRAAISRGELKTAEAMLGYPFTLDLAGAPALPSGKAAGGVAYDVSSQGRVLPPPGRYAARLASGGKPEGRERKPGGILVDGGCVIIGEGHADGLARPEYVEFLTALSV